MNNNDCPFCCKNGLLQGKIISTSQHAYLIENSYNPGNYLIIPEEHVTQIHELPETWMNDIKQLLNAIPELTPDNNITLNIGALAGQTQPHLHFWIVPRTTITAAPGKGLVGLLKLLQTT